MDISRLNPWNWFKNEEDQEKNVPVRRSQQYRSTPVEQLHSEIDRLFDSAFRGFWPAWAAGYPAPHGAEDSASVKPKLDVTGSDTVYTVTVELPGVDEKDVKLELRDRALIISGEKKHEHEEGSPGMGYYRMERSYGMFQRVLALPDDADADDIKATHKDGVLTITIPRHDLPKGESRVIEIR